MFCRACRFLIYTCCQVGAASSIPVVQRYQLYSKVQQYHMFPGLDLYILFNTSYRMQILHNSSLRRVRIYL